MIFCNKCLEQGLEVEPIAVTKHRGKRGFVELGHCLIHAHCMKCKKGQPDLLIHNDSGERKIMCEFCWARDMKKRRSRNVLSEVINNQP